MEPERFGEWTRVERAAYKKEVAAKRLRRLLACVGAALIVFSFAFFLLSLKPSVSEGRQPVAAAPKSETLHLTIPQMKRVKDVPVYTASAGNATALDQGVVHLSGTGFPWQRGANVYIVGHRLGYPNTGSFLVFYDLDNLRKGGRIVLRDSGGTRYVYRVFREKIVRPGQTSVTGPVPGKNVVSLQTCTLPDYTHRLIVQGELIRTVPKRPSSPAESTSEATSASPPAAGRYRNRS